MISPDLSQNLDTLRFLVGFVLLLREKRQILAAAPHLPVPANDWVLQVPGTMLSILPALPHSTQYI